MLSFRQAGCLFRTISHARTRVHIEGKYVRTRSARWDFPSVRRSCREIYRAAALEAAAVAGFLASAIAAAPSNPSFRNPSLPDWRTLCRTKSIHAGHTCGTKNFLICLSYLFVMHSLIFQESYGSDKFPRESCFFVFIAENVRSIRINKNA